MRLADACVVADKRHQANPIRLMSQVCKVLESIIRDHIIAFLSDKNVFVNQQHGFTNTVQFCSVLLELVDFPPIMPAFCLLLYSSYYSNNFAGIIDWSLSLI